MYFQTLVETYDGTWRRHITSMSAFLSHENHEPGFLIAQFSFSTYNDCSTGKLQLESKTPMRIDSGRFRLALMPELYNFSQLNWGIRDYQRPDLLIRQLRC